MTGVSSNNPQFQDPTFIPGNPQQQIDDQKPVTTGPGGSTGAPPASIGDMITRFQGPSNQGMPGSSRDFSVSADINSAIPDLFLPNSAPFTLNPIWMDYFASAITMPTTQDQNQDQGNFGFDAGGGDVDSGLTLPVPDDLTSTEQGKVFNALVNYTGIESNTALTGDQKLAFKEQLQTMAKEIATRNEQGPIPELASGNAGKISEFLTSIVPKNGMSAEDLTLFTSTLSTASTSITAGQYTGGLASTDPKAVLESLTNFTGFKLNPDLTDKQKTDFTNLLTELAANIAEQNATGKQDPALSSFDGKALTAYLMSQVDTSSLSAEDKKVFSAAMSEAGNAIGSVNAASGTTPAKGAILTGIESTDPAVVLATIKTVLAEQGLSSKQIEGLSDKLQAGLATMIAQANGNPDGSGLDITDANSLKVALLALLGSSNDIADADLQVAIGALATGLAAQNTTFFSQLSKSTDSAVVFLALRKLSNIDHNPNLSPSERQAALSYLKLMASALAFMSTVRAKIALLEAELRKAENAGKLAIIKDQTKAAADSFKTGMEKIGKDLNKQLEALALKALMAILGPIIMVIIAIIMAIITIFSFGTAAPVAAAIMVVVIVAMTVIAIADMQTGMFEKAGKASSDNPAGQKAASFGFQAIIFAIMIVFTFGVASFVVAAQIAIQTAVAIGREVFKQALTQILKEMTKEIVKKVLQFIIGEVLSLLFSSGLLTEGFVQLAKATGMNDKDAEIFAMVMSIVVVIVSMGVMAKGLGGIAKSGAKQAAKMAEKLGKSAVDEIEIAIEAAVKKSVSFAADVKGGLDDTIKSTADDAIGGAGDIAKTTTNLVTDTTEQEVRSAIDKIMKALAKKMNTMQELAKDPDTLLKLLQTLAVVAQVGAGLGQAVSYFNQAKLSEGLAKLETMQSESQALIEFLKTILPTFDMTQKDLDEASKDFLNGYNELMSLFADMVSSASAIVSETADTGR